MNPSAHSTPTAGDRSGPVLHRIRAVVPHLPPLRRKPAILCHALATARGAQFVLLVSGLALTLVLSPLVGSAIDRIYPDNRALFGLVKKKDLRNEARRRKVMAVLWVGAGAAGALLFWLHIPAAVAGAAARSRREAERADREREGNPRASLILYRRALSLTTDPAQEAALSEKVRALETLLTPAVAQTTAPAPGAGTECRSGELAPRFADRDRRYRVGHPLGRGNMGIVVQAHDVVLDRRVALKQLPQTLAADPDFVSRFQLEARALARLSHPNIVQVYDFFATDGGFFMVLELVEGGDLATYLKERGRVHPEQAARLAAPLAGALAYAHDQGVIHRDFKPANVLLTETGEPKVTDFGLAKIARASTLTQEGAILGSPLYMSPEQAAGRTADARSDIYALGITLYELLTGAPPFAGDTAGVLAQHITQPPVPVRRIVAEIPPVLEELVQTMLAKDPASRPADMTRVARALGEFAGRPTAHLRGVAPDTRTS